MLVNRRVWIAKPGRAGELLGLIEAMFNHEAWPDTVRMYRNYIAPFDHVAVEIVCESLAFWEEKWNQWTAAAFPVVEAATWPTLVEAGGTNEFWSIADERISETTAGSTNTRNKLVNRRVWIAKPGNAGKVTDFISSWFDEYTWPGAVRVYRNHLAPFDHVALEVECASLAAYEEHWGRWTTSHAEGVKLIESGGTNEIWTVEKVWAAE